MGKHAYMIVANGNFKVLEACLRMVDDKRNDIYVLFDTKAKVSETIRRHLSASLRHSSVRFYERLVNWGGYTQIAAVLELLEAAVNSGNSYDYLHFFQGSDLPIRSQDQIHAFFEAHRGEEFVQIEKSRKSMAQRKCWYRHFFCNNRCFRKNKLVKALNFGLMELQKLFGIKKNTDIELYQGSALFSITMPCAQYLLSRKEEIFKRFRFSLAPDEVFIQSILMDSEFGSRICAVDCDVSENVRLIDRTRPDGKNSPHVWRAEEFAAIMQSSENKLFARKFDERIDLDIVEAIYREVCLCEQTIG